MPELDERLAAVSPLDRVLVQNLRNAASALSEGALLLRSLIPGGKPEPLHDTAPVPSKLGKKRKQRVSNEPDASKKKKPLSGYIVFSNDERAKLKAANSSLTPKEIMSKNAERWRSLTEEEKQIWKTRAAAK